MRVMNHKWSARKQRLHLQSAAGISCHSALSEDRIRQCGTSSESRCKDTDQCLQVAISFCRHRSVPVLYENGSVETTSSFRMRVINHNWSAMKQCLHPQSVAEISHHSVLSGDSIRVRQCVTSSRSRHKDTDQCL